MNGRILRRAALTAAAVALAVPGAALAAAPPPPGPAPAAPVTSGSHYDRNPSVVQDGATTYMFFARTQAPCDRLPSPGGCPADNTFYDLYMQTSSNGGATWGPATRIADNSDIPQGINGQAYGRTVAATRTATGDIWVFWVSGGSASGMAYLHKAPDSNSFVVAGGLTDKGYFNVEAVAKDNTVYLYYEEAAGDAGPGNGVYVRTFDGTTFSPATPVTLGRSIPKVTIDLGGVFRMVTVDGSGADYVRSSADGLAWGPETQVVTPGGTVTNWDPNIVQTPDGLYRLYYAPDLGDSGANGSSSQRIATKISATPEGLAADPGTIVTQPTPGSYWDYWPEPFVSGGVLRLFYTSELNSNGDSGIGHIWSTSSQVRPANKDQCKKDGYKAFGYGNQGQCVSDAPK